MTISGCQNIFDDHIFFVYLIKFSTPNGKSPYIGIVKAASSLNDTFQFYSNLLINTYNVKLENLYDVPIDTNHTSNAEDPKVAEEIKKLTGIFFVGGDQENIVECFFRKGGKGTGREKTIVFSAIESQYNSGSLVVSGSSAGTTIQQGANMVSGGESYNGLTTGVFDFIDDHNEDNVSYDVDGGFGFYPYGFLDTHFGTRGRQVIYLYYCIFIIIIMYLHYIYREECGH